MAAAIASGAELSFGDDSDMAACERMTDLLRDAFAVLRDVQAHAAAAFKRLYRNRNLVLHGGHTDSVGLVSSLRTAGPLVGAGMDRIAHAWFVESVRPMELAARAQMGLNTVGSKGGPLPVDLLM